MRNRPFGEFWGGWKFLLPLLVSLAGSAFAQETWTSGDIGSPALVGSSSYNAANDTFTVNGAGADIWGTADQFQFTYQAVSGNCELVARVVSLQNTNGWAKAGLMLREDLTAGGKNALVAATVSNGVTYQWRYTAGASSGSATGGSGVAPVWVKLKRLGDQVTYYRSADGQTWTQIGTQNVAMNSTVYAGLVVTSHNTGALATAIFDHVSLSASGTGTLPSPWNDADIGAVGYRGYAVFDGTSTFSVAGGGADIWGTADAFHFLYQPLVGDGAVQARVLTQQNTNAWAKAGGMIRESLDPGSKHGMSMYSSVYGMFFQSRNTTGGSTMGLPALGGTAPIWTKVERRGPVIIGWKSLDGATWDWVGSQAVSMAAQAYAGLAVNAHNNGALSLATFDNLQVTAGRENTLPTPWNDLMLGSPILGGWADFANNTFTLYAGGGDIWGPADQGEFVYRPLNGDGTITLKVANVKNSQEWVKAGVMMRETLSPDARHVLWGVSPTHGVLLQKRVTPGTTPSNYYDGATVAPVWLKLQRTGNIFTASKSSDGVTWNVFGTETVPMDTNIYAGAILSSPSTTVIGQTDIPTLTMTAPSAHNYAPLAWWPMNEGSGTTLLDATGGQHDAVISGTMDRTSGHDGSGAINLPSGDATAYVTTQTLMPGTSSLSISAWFKTTDSGVRRIISKGHWGATTGFLLGIGHSAPGRLTFGIGGGTAAESVLMSTTESFNNGAWHHVVGVYDSLAHTARIYVDGVMRNVALTGSIWGGAIIENGKALDTSALTHLSTTSNIALHVGSYNGQYERWIGELDDVRLYAAALDDLDDQSLYTDGDSDGMPDSWEQSIVDFSSTDNITSMAQVLPGGDFDGDGLSNLQEYQQGTDPTDYYNGQPPTLTVSGDNQSGPRGIVLPTPLVVTVTRAGMALNNAPVDFLVTAGGGQIATSETGALADEQIVRTGADGTASIYLAPGGSAGTSNRVQVEAASGNQSVTAVFTATASVTPQIEGGNGFSIALKSDGTVWAWGSNQYGQLGNGTTTDSATPVKVLLPSGIEPVAVGAGMGHSMAVTSDGQLYTWGDNSHGQLGYQTSATTYSTEPTLVPGISNVKEAVGGGSHSTVLKKDGTVWGWGDNSFGQLGDGTNANSSTPIEVSGLTDVNHISAGGLFSCAVRADGSVLSWGSNNHGTLGIGSTAQSSNLPVQAQNLTDVVLLKSKQFHVLAITSLGDVWGWGWNYDGQLGDGTNVDRYTPVQVSGASGMHSIATGSSYSVAVKDDGTVWTWGRSITGDRTMDKNTPVQMNGISNVAVVASGLQHVLAYKSDGQVWAWGPDDHGTLGDGNLGGAILPVNVPGLTNIKKVSGGAYYTLALDAGNAGVWAFGQNESGQLGDGTINDSTTPFEINGLSNIADVTAGWNHSLAVNQDGELWDWGSNSEGKLGPRIGGIPLTIPGAVNSGGGTMLIDSVAAGDSFSVSLDKTGQEWVWGRYSETGNPLSVTNLPPTIVASNISAIGASNDKNWMAIDDNRNVWVWGENSSGQLGNGTFTGAYGAPNQVTNLSGVQNVAVGGLHMLALKDGIVWSWGGNYTGELGNGTPLGQKSAIPAPVANLDNVVAIAAGTFHSLALKSDGTVWAWGYNNNLQSGGGATNLLVPTQVAGVDHIKAIAAGTYHSLALKEDGTLMAWGDIHGGQLGVGRSVYRTAGPVLGLNLATHTPPTVSLSSSANGSAVVLGNTISLEANATATSGTIHKVEFYRDGIKIGEADAAPYQISWTPTTWGNFNFSAIATDDSGSTSLKSVVPAVNVPYDSNNDNVADWWEVKYFHTVDVDLTDDPDHDGLNNLQEYQNHDSDPTVFEEDSDGDGFSNADELAVGADPTNDQSQPIPRRSYAVLDLGRDVWIKNLNNKGELLALDEHTGEWLCWQAGNFRDLQLTTQNGSIAQINDQGTIIGSKRVYDSSLPVGYGNGVYRAIYYPASDTIPVFLDYPPVTQNGHTFHDDSYVNCVSDNNEIFGGYNTTVSESFHYAKWTTSPQTSLVNISTPVLAAKGGHQITVELVPTGPPLYSNQDSVKLDGVVIDSQTRNNFKDLNADGCVLLLQNGSAVLRDFQGNIFPVKDASRLNNRHWMFKDRNGGAHDMPAYEMISFGGILKKFQKRFTDSSSYETEDLSQLIPSGYLIDSISGLNDAGIISALVWKDGANNRTGAILIPVEAAPDVLRVNSDFDEQKIDPETHYAKPDNEDDDLEAERGDKQGKIITADLYKGFWGLNPNTLPTEFFEGAVVTITKKTVDDSETGKPEKGTIRLYAIKNVGSSDETAYPIKLSSTLTPSVSSDSPVNLVDELYGSSAPVPRGDNITYWIEGVDPGLITLEFKYVKGSLTFTYEQKFKVVTQQSKEEWQKELRDQIFLESQGAVDMNSFDPSSSFTTNIKFIKSVYGYYEQLYKKYPDEFLWAGMAKMAGAPVFAGLSDAEYVVHHPLSDLEATVIHLLSSNLTEVQHQLMLANKSIYDDLGWQHRAYVASGILALKYVDDNDISSSFRKVDMPSWNRIDQGIEDGLEPSQNVIEGNKTLLQREQRDIVQGIYATLEGLRASSLSILSSLFSDFVPETYNKAFSMFAKNPIPGGMTFELFDPIGNIGVFQDRWNWIAGDDYEGMYQIWSGVSPTKGYDSTSRIDQVNIPLSTRARDYSDYPTKVP